MTEGHPAPKSERVKLSREFSEFLVDLSIALHRYSMYPSGHPSLDPAVDTVMRRAERLLEDRPSIAFGVARRQLIIEGVATDPDQPVLRRLAEGLHRHHLGAISISRGVEASEIADALRELAAEPETGDRMGLPGRRLPTWPHVKLHPMAFDGLAVVGDAPLARSASDSGSRSAELWVGLARAAISVDEARPPDAVPLEPVAVARSIDEHPRAEAYDQVIVGYMLQIASELKTAAGAEAEALRRRTSKLVAALQPETLRRIVEMGGDARQRGAFVLDAAHGMAPEAVLDIVKAAADASGQTISHGLMRMLSKLAAHAETAPEQAKPMAAEALREQVGRLLSDWQLEDPNPESYGRLLQHLATSAGSATRSDARLVFGDADPLRLVQMSLELNMVGPLLDPTIGRAVGEGWAGSVLQLLDARPDSAAAAADAIVARLLRPESLKTLLAREPLDIDTLDRLMPFMTPEGYEVLLDTLATTEHRASRRKLLERLAAATVDLWSLIMARLGDEHWYVQRNMLVLLQRLERVPEGFSPARWTAHPDARVRAEAIRVQLAMPGESEKAIRTALADQDPRVVAAGLGAVTPSCPRDVVDQVVRIILTPNTDEGLQLLAIAAVGRLRQPRVRDALLRLADGGRTLFGKVRLPSKTPGLLAAIQALAEIWPSDPQAAAVVAAAAGSSDPELRKAARPAQP